MGAWASRYARSAFERCERNKRRACHKLGISDSHAQRHRWFRPGVDEEVDRAAITQGPRMADTVFESRR